MSRSGALGEPSRSPMPEVTRLDLGVAGILVGARPVVGADERALSPEEAFSLADAMPPVRDRSAAARVVARALMADLGLPPVALPRVRRGPPAWPPGVVGSLAHADALAVCAVARRDDAIALGVDVEPAEPLAPDMIARIATERERARLDVSGSDARRLIVAKEAAYKAAFHLDRAFLDWHGIEVDLAAGIAVLATGRRVPFAIADAQIDGIGPHVVAVARIAA